LGPMKATLCAARISAKRAFSDRKPYPGWTASAPVISHAASSCGTFRYDSRAGGGPMQTLSSARRTCMASSSAVEWTATVAIPNSFAARRMRSAISPRFAIRILSNIALFDHEQGLAVLHRLAILNIDSGDHAGAGRRDLVE